MRLYVSAICWASAILTLALAARFGWVEREAAELLLLVLPMVAFVTLLDSRDCRRPARDA